MLATRGKRTVEALRPTADKARTDAQRGRGWYAGLARVGLVAKGISYGIVGVLAVKLALGSGGEATSRGGALEALAEEPFGKVFIGLLAAGFAAHALWRLVQAFAEREDPADGEAIGATKKWGKRAGGLGSAAIYGGLTFLTVRLLLGLGGEEPQNQTARESTATVFDLPAGRWIVGLAGLAVIAFGAWSAYRAHSRDFEADWRPIQTRGDERRWGSRAGVAGHAARGGVFALIGLFVVKAAWEYDANEAIGLDGALQKLAQASYGPWLLGLAAAGLICYGIYCLADAHLRDVSAGTSGS